MFAYCLNNPVNYIDAAGLLPSWNDIQQTVEEIFDEISDYWDRHANRNDEQDEYLEKLKKQCGSEKAMLEYTGNALGGAALVLKHFSYEHL